MLFEGRTLAPNASAVSKPPSSGKPIIGGLDTAAEEHRRLLDHQDLSIL